MAEQVNGSGKRIKVVGLPTTPGRMSLRFFDDDQYLGEVELFAINPEAGKRIVRDLFTRMTGVVLPG